MEMLSAIAPFFVAGLMGTIFARFTGMNMSMCVLLLFCIWEPNRSKPSRLC